MKRLTLWSNTAVVFACALAIAPGLQAQGQDPVGLTPTPDDVDEVSRPRFSPYAGRNFPTSVYWGDTHLHTNNSLDARGLGVLLGPEDAYRFARGEEVIASHGLPVKLSRPLDWLAVADHSDGMGVMKEIIRGNPNFLKDPVVREWHNEIIKGGPEAFTATMNVILAFAGGGNAGGGPRPTLPTDDLGRLHRHR
jgi:hypothetical protein